MEGECDAAAVPDSRFLSAGSGSVAEGGAVPGRAMMSGPIREVARPSARAFQGQFEAVPQDAARHSIPEVWVIDALADSAFSADRPAPPWTLLKDAPRFATPGAR